ncbi:MAG: dicarboxylate/amino acid:cation symporter [Lentisphaerae bacterium]|nr:dicarboxylate/amino acid:cation symporter [Lentisphaerota bacterium]
MNKSASPAGGFKGKRLLIWMAALIIGAVLGTLGINWLDELCNFIASIYTRLFKFIAVPTIALAITTTLATLGTQKDTGKIFKYTIVYTLLTTLVAAVMGAVLYKVIAPGNLPVEAVRQGAADVPQNLKAISVYDHILAVVPDNVLLPFSSGNVLSILLVSAALGLALAALKDSANVQILTKAVLGFQEVLFALIRALVWALPVGIVAFSAQLSAQVSAGMIVGSLGKYVAVVLGGNILQFFVILPLFLLAGKLNPFKVFKGMLPALLMAFFTKSSAATLPVTVESAEKNLNARPQVARFILPVCCTINMNGCAAFILVTSLFVMQNGGMVLTLPNILLWILISVISAVGNAGVPMGCYFLTLSLMSGVGAPLGIMGIILPIFTVIDMVETGVNVWSDSCICAIVNKKLDDENSAAECSMSQEINATNLQ